MLIQELKELSKAVKDSAYHEISQKMASLGFVESPCHGFRLEYRDSESGLCVTFYKTYALVTLGSFNLFDVDYA